MITTQLASTSAIIASQERISERVDNLSYGIEKVEQGIYGLQASFEWGISEVVWQIEQNREVLRDILQVLSAPLDTQAKELRKRAEEAYTNGWIDDALKDFLESEEKNRYDFSIHISLGMIYLFHKIDKEKALKYFDQAIKYAKPKSPYHTSYALLHKALIMRDIGQMEEAEKCTNEAIEISKNFSEAFYQNAQYNALLNRPQKAIPMLEKAIEYDINYCEKCHNEKDFDNIRDSIATLFEKLRKRKEDNVKVRFPKITERYNKISSVVDLAKKEFDLKINDHGIHTNFNRIEKLIKRHSFRDYLEASRVIDEVTAKINKLYKETQNEIDKKISSLRSKIRNIESSHESNYIKDVDNLNKIWLVGIPVSIIIGIGGCFVTVQNIHSSLGNVLYSLFVIPFIILLLLGLGHICIYSFLKSNKNYRPLGVDSIEGQINRVQKISDKLKGV